MRRVELNAGVVVWAGCCCCCGGGAAAAAADEAETGVVRFFRTPQKKFVSACANACASPVAAPGDVCCITDEDAEALGLVKLAADARACCVTREGAQAAAEFARAPPCNARFVEGLAQNVARVGDQRAWARLQAWIPDLSGADAPLTQDQRERVALVQRAVPHAACFTVDTMRAAASVVGFVDGLCGAARMRCLASAPDGARDASDEGPRVRVHARCLTVADPLRCAHEMLAAQAAMRLAKRTKFALGVVFTAAVVVRDEDAVHAALRKFHATSTLLLVTGSSARGSVAVRDALVEAAKDREGVWSLCAVDAFKNDT